MNVDTYAAQRVHRVRACWVHIGGAGNVVVGNMRAGGVPNALEAGQSKYPGGAETCLPGPGFVGMVWDVYGTTVTHWLWA